MQFFEQGVDQEKILKNPLRPLQTKNCELTIAIKFCLGSVNTETRLRKMCLCFVCFFVYVFISRSK